MKLFEQPKAEAVRQSLQEASKKHEKELCLLRKLLDFSPSQEDYDSTAGAEGIIMKKLRSIEVSMQALESRVAKIENSIEIPGNKTANGDVHVTVGQGVERNRKTLARALNLISRKADADEAEKSRASLNQAVLDANEELKHTIAALEKSNESITSLSQRIDVLSSEMHTKANHSDIKMIQTDASLISQHLEFQRATKEANEQSKCDLKIHDESISRNSEEISALAKRLTTLQMDLDSRASSESIDTVQQKVSEMSSTLSYKVEQGVFDSLRSNFEDRHATIAKLEQDLQSLISSQEAASAHLKSQLREQRDAVGQLVSGCVSREALATILGQMQRTEHSLSELTAEHLITKKQATLAAQFIAWYGNNSRKEDGSARFNC